MSTRVHEDCFVIVPRSESDYARVGLYSSDKCTISDSLYFRGSATTPAFNGKATEADFTNVSKRLNGEFLFGGIIFTHFGHLLVETFSRLWTFFESTLPILFIDAPHNNNYLFWRLIDAMNLPGNRIVLASEDCYVKKLHVSPPGFSIRRDIDPKNVKYFERISSMLGGEINTIERPIYLSRTKTRKNNRYTFGEVVLEKIIASRGIDIVHLQELPLSEQILLLKSRKNIFGFSGSAFHLLLFCKGKKNIIYFDTRPVNENFKLVESQKNNNASYVLLQKNANADKVLFKFFFLRPKTYEGPFLLSPQAIVKACRCMGVNIQSTDIDAELMKSETEAFAEWMLKTSIEELYQKLVDGKISPSKAEIELQMISEGLKSSLLASLERETLAISA